MSYGIDDKGLIHEVLDNRGTICGRLYFASGWTQTETETDVFVTCFQCMHPGTTKDCGHAGAEIRNCPYAADIRSNQEQRCKCCRDCAHECAMDI